MAYRSTNAHTRGGHTSEPVPAKSRDFHYLLNPGIMGISYSWSASAKGSHMRGSPASLGHWLLGHLPVCRLERLNMSTILLVPTEDTFN